MIGPSMFGGDWAYIKDGGGDVSKEKRTDPPRSKDPVLSLLSEFSLFLLPANGITVLPPSEITNCGEKIIIEPSCVISNNVVF